MVRIRWQRSRNPSEVLAVYRVASRGRNPTANSETDHLASRLDDESGRQFRRGRGGLPGLDGLQPAVDGRAGFFNPPPRPPLRPVDRRPVDRLADRIAYHQLGRPWPPDRAMPDLRAGAG